MKFQSTKFYLLSLAFLCVGQSLMAHSNGEQLIQEYIDTYMAIAIQEKKSTGVPVSIKLAQGIIESRYGTSALAQKSNNHFGIKCKIDWKGESVTAHDDAPNECFRKYPTVEESYSDHSKFLKNNRLHFYDHLFELDSRDYRSWAMGLQKAGYSTTNYYARSLIHLIEKYGLFQLDGGTIGYRMPEVARTDLSSKAKSIYKLKYKESGTKIFPKDIIVPESPALPSVKIHTVKEKDTMESIAKRYKKSVGLLYDLNKMTFGSQPAIGEKVYLNSKAIKAPQLRTIQYRN